MFCGAGRGKFTRSTESFTEHPGEVGKHGVFNGARRGGGSTGVSPSTEKGVEEHGLFNGGSMEDAQFYSILLCFYKAGKARIGNFFLAKSFKVS